MAEWVLSVQVWGPPQARLEVRSRRVGVDAELGGIAGLSGEVVVGVVTAVVGVVAVGVDVGALGRIRAARPSPNGGKAWARARRRAGRAGPVRWRR